MPHEDWLLSEGYRDSEHPGTAHAVGAQFLLSSHNVHARAWYGGRLDGDFGAASADAAKKAKYDLGYATWAVKPTFGPLLRDYLTGTQKRSLSMIIRARHRATKFVWPTVPHGNLIGFPGVGTHSFVNPPNNWESDNAWDIAVREGSRVVAICDGTIGKQFGPLPDPDPRFHGIRLHLLVPGGDDEFYYAHLNATAGGIRPGVKVKQGQVLGASGRANGVAHLHIATRRLFRLGEL